MLMTPEYEETATLSVGFLVLHNLSQPPVFAISVQYLE